MKQEFWNQHRFLQGIYLMGRRYLRHSVGIHSAALAFYLLFTIFPLLIFISALLGVLQLDMNAILETMGRVLPFSVVNLAGVYLRYVSANPNPRLMMFGLVFSIWFPMRATNSLMRSVRTAYRLGAPQNAVIHLLKTLLYTVLLIASVALTLALMTVGTRILNYAVETFGLPAWAAELWVRLRFPAMAAIIFFALFFLYELSQDTFQPWKNIWPGTLAALIGWMALSWLYALYVENFAHYSLLYGSIGTVIVLMIWLNLSALILIMGAELNGTLISMRKDAPK